MPLVDRSPTSCRGTEEVFVVHFDRIASLTGLALVGCRRSGVIICCRYEGLKAVRASLTSLTE